VRLIKRIRAFFFRPKDKAAAIADYLYDEILYKSASSGLDESFYEFGRIFFTGWKAAQDVEDLKGQLLFWPPERTPDRLQRYFYVNLPGMEAGEYHKGDCFNLSNYSDFAPVTRQTDPKVIQMIVTSGVKRLIDIVCEAQPEWLVKFAQRK
jgi:hypothetical protein